VGWEEELVPFGEMPSAIDPPAGFVASANNRPVADDDSGPFLGVDWMDGYRQARIVEALAARSDWDADACARLQLDVTSLPWRQVRDIALSLPVGDGDGRLGLELLSGWDGQVGADSVGAAVFELWLADLAHRIARAKAPSAWRYALGDGFGEIVPLTTFHSGSLAQTVDRLCRQADGWFERGWLAEAADALSAAVARLKADHGEDPAGWAWGRLRTLTLRHPVGGQALLARSFNIGPVSMPGDGTTPLQAASGPLRPLDNPGYLPNTRAVIDLADPGASRWALAGGQSGNPLSRHYRDLFDLWHRGEAIPIPWSEEDVTAATRTTLRLEPRT
jgi:penicillin amidase